MTDHTTSRDSETPDDDHTDPSGVESTQGRRTMLRNLVVGSAGAAVGAVAIGDRAAAGTSGGAPVGGNALELGDTATNTATSATTLTYTGSDPVVESVLEVRASGEISNSDTAFSRAAISGIGGANVQNGVIGLTDDSFGNGVGAYNLSSAVDDATDAPAGLQVGCIGGPQIRFAQFPGAVVGPTSGRHGPGELYMDIENTLWYTVPTPENLAGIREGIRFAKLAGATTAGSFHFLPKPVRITDSRGGTKPAEDSTVVVDLTVDQDGEASGIPAIATGVQLNVTVAQTESRSYFSIAAANVEIAESPEFSTGNWFADNQVVTTSALSALDDDGRIQVRFGPLGGAHLLIDCVGYYL